MSNPTIRVLYVEDDAFQAHVMAHMLHKAIENLELMWIARGEDALAFLQSKEPFCDRARYPQPDVVLLDLKLEGIGGFEVLKSGRGCCSDRRIVWAVS